MKMAMVIRGEVQSEVEPRHAYKLDCSGASSRERRNVVS